MNNQDRQLFIAALLTALAMITFIAGIILVNQLIRFS
ncbi:hypothetical protein BD809_109105 [Aquimarina intermedia]|uniref:Uncharacterized protein n=1 Tax=Aquimarina intermedia TaxID=350814 RepID=A0A5S5C0N5_9FLAO|nr:hypothetical protein BD809_109105 [Aquimarina intermedia]